MRGLFRTKIKIFAPRIGVNEINRLRGTEIRCIKVRFPPNCDFHIAIRNDRFTSTPDFEPLGVFSATRSLLAFRISP